MKRAARRALVVPVVLCLALLSACSSLPTQHAEVSVPLPADRSRPQVGVQYFGLRGGQTDGQRHSLLVKLKGLGVTWLRIGLPWQLVQPNPPSSPGGGWSYNAGLKRVDNVFSWAHDMGFQISVTFTRPPAWANGGHGGDTFPTDPATYASAIAFLAKRYQKQVQSWEVWNEPNNKNFNRNASVEQYTTLLCAAYRAIKQAVPKDVVISGGTAGNDWQWVEGMYKAGAKGCFDVLATHPYNSNQAPTLVPPNDNQWWFQNISLVRDVMVNNGDAATPVWFTEIGWSTARDPNRPGRSGGGVSYATQAQYLVETLALTHDKYPYVKRLSWFQAQDQKGGTIHNDNFGLYTLTGQPKPAAFALKKYLAGGS